MPQNRNMREYIFRGKNLENGMWPEGHYVSILTKNGTSYRIVCDDGSASCEIDPRTLGQFTGVYDANGKMIFEGDIVHRNRRAVESKALGITDIIPELKAEVVFKNGAFGVEWEEQFSPFLMYGFSPDAFAVIGNIYDHPWKLKMGTDAK